MLYESRVNSDPAFFHCIKLTVQGTYMKGNESWCSFILKWILQLVSCPKWVLIIADTKILIWVPTTFKESKPMCINYRDERMFNALYLAKPVYKSCPLQSIKLIRVHLQLYVYCLLSFMKLLLASSAHYDLLLFFYRKLNSAKQKLRQLQELVKKIQQVCWCRIETFYFQSQSNQSNWVIASFIEILDQTLLSKMFLNSSHALFHVLLERISTPKLHH